MKLKTTLIACILSLLFLSQTSQAKSNNKIAGFKIGKSNISYQASNMTLGTSANDNNAFVITLSKTNKKSKATLQFSFDDVDLELGSYRLVAPGNYVEGSGDILTEISFTQNKGSRVKGLYTEDNSTGVGTMTITAIDYDSQSITANFNFTTSVAFVTINNRGVVKKATIKQISLRNGILDTSLAGIGRQFFMHGHSFFNNDNRFAPDNKSNSPFASIAGSSAASFKVDGTNYFFANDEVETAIIQENFTALGLNIQGQSNNGSYLSTLTFVFRNSDLENVEAGQVYELSSSSTFNASQITRRTIAYPIFRQEYTSQSEGIQSIEQSSVSPNLRQSITGTMVINSYNPSNRELSASFYLNMNVLFLHTSTEGYIKGPETRTISITDGYFSAILP